MIEIVTSLFSISLIAAFIALLLEIADHYFSDYGEKSILINDEKEFIVKGGKPLLFTLAEKKIFLPSACGGKGTCAYCKVKVLEGGGPVLPTETPYLTGDEIKDRIRISCQVKVKDNLKISIPEELFQIKEFRVRVEKIEMLSPDIKYIDLRIISPEEGITFKAGQYVQLEIPRYELTNGPEFRAYSIASPPFEHQMVGLVITRVPEGAVSTYVHDYLQINEELSMRGPFGEFGLHDSDRDLLMIATGSGLAPILSMIYFIQEHGIKRKATLLFGDRKPKDLIFYEELREFERTLAGFTYIPTLSRTSEEDNWDGEKGRVTDLIAKYVPDNPQIDVYVCGVPAMVHSCLEILVQKGVPPDRICFDKFE